MPYKSNSVKIGCVVLAWGVSKNSVTKKKSNHARVIFHTFAQTPPKGRQYEFWLMWYRRRNHPCEILYRSVQEFRNSDTPNFSILRRLSWSLLQQCKHYRATLWWEREKFDPRHPKTPKPMVTKISTGDYVEDIYHHAKFHPNRFRGFVSAHAWFPALRHNVTRLFFLFFWGGGSWERLPPRRAHRLWRTIRQTTWFRARKCLVGSQNQYLRLDPTFPETAIFGPHFDRTNFRPKRL